MLESTRRKGVRAGWLAGWLYVLQAFARGQRALRLVPIRLSDFGKFGQRL